MAEEVEPEVAGGAAPVVLRGGAGGGVLPKVAVAGGRLRGRVIEVGKGRFRALNSGLGCDVYGAQ